MNTLISDLALILVVAGIVTLVFKQLKQPLVLGYIVAGFLVSPHMPYVASVVDKENIEVWADIGVMFLLFSLGLDFSFKKILKMGLSPVIAACTIIFCMSTLGFMVGKSFGWGQMNCIFLGGMLAMSSTTIIYKAFDDLGLSQQRFASLVMSVLILEDLLAIVMMVMLSTIASGNSPNGSQMALQVLNLAAILILWFVVGIFLIPMFLRSTRKLMTEETLLIVSLGLCCLMAVIAHKAGFSEAFGAFVMGSILAETIEADKIIKVVEPVKNLFGAIFFVSVGMLVDPKVLIEYWFPIVVLTLTILLGQSILGSMGFLLSGQTLKTAMRCGFSMTQIGEFAFIIASLGLSLGVISHFLYPVVVAVSVVTTFLTPYMIKAAEPCYAQLERRLPKRWIRSLNHLGNAQPTSDSERSNWRKLLMQTLMYVVIYSILSAAVIALMFTFVQPFINALWPTGAKHGWTNLITALLTIVFISPFLRAMIMKKNHSEEFKALWTEQRINRLPLLFTVVARIIYAASFVFYIINHLSHFTNAVVITLALIATLLMIMSRRLKNRSIKLERMFLQNLHSREIEAQVHGRTKPLYERHLLDRDIHLSEFTIPKDSAWAGETLEELQFRNKFGVHISSILRGSRRINIPHAETVVFPGDKLQAIGSDEQLHNFGKAMRSELVEEDFEIEKREMKLRQFTIGLTSPFIGKTLKESRIREDYDCMVVGIEEGEENLTLITPSRKFEQGDIVWIVGEEKNIKSLMSQEKTKK